jgi:hypothetical protein
MKLNWETKIAENFWLKDASATFDRKEQLWKQMALNLGHNNGVSSWWKAAAIILVVISIGAVAGAVYRTNSLNNTNKNLQNENYELLLLIDSLQTIKPEGFTDTITVEKKVIVYRNVLKYQERKENTPMKTMEDSNETAQLNSKIELKNLQLKQVKDSLKMAKTRIEELELIALKSKEENLTVFKLKPEKAQEQLQPAEIKANPKMKLQLLKIQNDNIKFDSNSTLLKK